MKRLVIDQAWIIGLCAVIYFTQLGATRLWDLDEPLYAACAREMAERGDWVVPMFNGDLFHDKPPLMFWTMIFGAKLFGWTEFGVRFFSAVFGILTALTVYHLGRILFGRVAGFWAGVVMAVNVMFTVSARAATVDAALTLTTCLAFAALVFGRRRLFDPSSSCEPIDPAAAIPLKWAVPMWAAIAVAVLAKGPVGLLLPAAAIGLLLMLEIRAARSLISRSGSANTERIDLTPPHTQQTVCAQGWLRAGVASLGRFASAIVGWLVSLADPKLLGKAFLTMRPLTGAVVVALIALPWYYLVAERTDGVWLREFLGKYNLGPFVKPFMGHHGPFFYHFVMILVGLFPWSLFLAPTLYHAYYLIRNAAPEAAGARLGLCWAGVWFAFWSLCSTKLPHYVLPAYPALALLTGRFLADWTAEPTRFRAAWSRNAAWTLVIVGIALGIGGAGTAYWFVPGEEIVGLVGLPLIIGGLVCVGLHTRKAVAQFVPVVAATGAAFLLAVFGWAADRIDRHQHSPELAQRIRDHHPQAQLGSFRFLQASMVYYYGRNVTRFDAAEPASDFLRRNPNGLLITLAAHEAELRRGCPLPLKVVETHPRFLAPGKVIVLASDEATPTTAAESSATSGELRR